MQYYRDGYRSGDPDLQPAAPEAVSRTGDIPAEVDVLIVGTGPAGTVLAAQLSEFPDITTRIVERRGEPLTRGHADGVACRTVEMFEAFGLADALLREAYWVNEVHFWGPCDDDRAKIVRTGWVQDTPPGLSEFPHVIVNQARMQHFLLQHAARSASRLEADYGVEFVTLTVHERDDHPVEVTLRRGDKEITVNANYVVGCDGARSKVRSAIGRELAGDAANHAWGVMDVLATTDFPDWRTKNVIQSAGKGSLLMIPREGGNMVRCYVDLGEIPAGDSTIRSTTAEQLAVTANAILHPYAIDVKQCAWSSVYEVGQRLADRFDDVTDDDDRIPHVFIAGDACHTHSAKAGQGMNVSMQDAFNLGWKLAAVLQGRSAPQLLRTYSGERQTVAADLIEFDKFWSAFIAQPTVDPQHPELGGVTSQQMQAEFARQGRYTAGLATTYTPSSLTGTDEHQDLARGFQIGTRFHSSPAVRVADAYRGELGHVHRADGRWRLYAFGDADGSALRELAQWLTDAAQSPIARFTAASADIDSVIDVRAVFHADHHDVDLGELPEILLPRSGSLGLQDWEKVWAVGADADIFAARGISDRGAVVIVRPDQYVAHVLPLDARDELTDFFGGFLLPVEAE
ncbi:3-hydroxybenzoate 4-monooxygenase [Microbacterium protaetiae]|uniref:3-hydroxybenzoate 4-monooxygenase n=1 Tax=Microbacterium protaetiae TaxID=2509458 RepID=A0A4V0YD33_9MICO|nr:FAD-dependent monooxygenase [Microbacterium protaetiae]QAY59311.1 3-hydroxybenzoate 4-monooxygenase [Microbacterium protaetiae]